MPFGDLLVRERESVEVENSRAVMEFRYCFNEVASLIHICKVKIKVKNEQGEETGRECGDAVKVSKDSYWNLKRHIARKHEDVLRKHGAAKGELVTYHKKRINR